jgi:4-amino-4-deoxy-L-arabinose transferase-like glycosyltransferase
MRDFGIKDYIVLTVLFLVGFWLWTLPIQSNPLPFGEHDAAYIFSYGDDMTFKDKSPAIAGETPTSIDFWYATWNKVLGPRALEYPPPYTMDYSFAQKFGGERIVPAYIFVAISCFLAVFAMYLLIRKLYGFEAALITSTALLFSFREILLYMWGQRHNVTAFAFVPIAIYALYVYLKSFYEGKEKIAYLYIFTLLALCTYLIHLGATVFLAPFTIVLILVLAIKHKKLPIAKKNIKHYLILAVILIAIIANFYVIYFGPESTNSDVGVTDIGSLVYWLRVPENNFGMNPAFIEHNATYMGSWSYILLFLGILVLLLRRKDEDMVLISALITLYIVFHLQVFGLVDADNYRIARFLIIESYFFYAIMAVGVVNVVSFIKMDPKIKKYLKLGLAILFIGAIIFTQGISAHQQLKNAYRVPLRITPAQYELTEWIQENIPETSGVTIKGTLTYPKKAFIQILSRRVMDRRDPYMEIYPYYISEDVIKPDTKIPEYYVNGTDMVIPLEYLIIDYSDLAITAGLSVKHSAQV